MSPLHKEENVFFFDFFFFLMIENTVSLLLIEPIHLWQMQAVLQIRQVCQQGHPQKKLLMLQYILSC